MRNALMTLAATAALATAVRAQENPAKPSDQPAVPGSTVDAAPKKPSMVCKDGVCSDPPPPAAEKKAAAKTPVENLTFGIYGIADLALLYRDNYPNDPAKPASGTTNYLTFISGGRNQSRIGLNGSYDLGDGMRAMIQLEKGFNYNDGTCEDGAACDPLQFFNRRAWLGLEQEGVGRFMFGRQLTAMYDIVIQIDPMGYSPAFSWLPTAGSADPKTGKINAGRYGTRVDRMIKYMGRFGGTQLIGYYALGDSTTAIVSNSRFGGGAIVKLGPATLAAVYDQRNQNLTAAGLVKEQAFVLAARVSLLDGFIVPTVGVRHYNRTLTAVRDDLFFAGVALKATDKLSFTVADYYDKKNDDTGQNENLLVLRANYFLGKIVETYATYGHASGSNGGFAGVMRANDSAPVADGQNGFAVGLRIRFGYGAAGE